MRIRQQHLADLVEHGAQLHRLGLELVEPERTTSAGSVASVAVGDFNNDGKLDIAVAGFTNSNGYLIVLLGNGNGTFQTHVDYSLPLHPSKIVVGDFNRDGNLDLAIACDSNVSILLGTGSGTFTAGASRGSQLINDMAVGDLNGDGILDLVFTSFQNGANAVFYALGDNSGDFRSAHVNRTLLSPYIGSGAFRTGSDRRYERRWLAGSHLRRSPRQDFLRDA